MGGRKNVGNETRQKFRMAHNSMNQVVRHRTTVARNVNNKRKLGSDHGRNSGQQQSKRLGVVRTHASRPCNKKAYAGNLPYCNKCKLHHAKPYNVKCGK
ncbi:hypothetical protein Tco_0865317 [Tanacetum coccineum]